MLLRIFHAIRSEGLESGHTSADLIGTRKYGILASSDSYSLLKTSSKMQRVNMLICRRVDSSTFNDLANGAIWTGELCPAPKWSRNEGSCGNGDLVRIAKGCEGR